MGEPAGARDALPLPRARLQIRPAILAPAFAPVVTVWCLHTVAAVSRLLLSEVVEGSGVGRAHLYALSRSQFVGC